jgi:release factor glutamine methyltransferase
MVQTLQNAVSEAARILADAGISEARRESALLLANTLKTDTNILHLEPKRKLDRLQYADFSDAVNRRASREPMSHILGHREFWSLDFLVGPQVLDPRPDSETLIEAVLAAKESGVKIDSILDLGVGSGCLLLSILSELPDATGVGIDQSLAAIKLAAQNADRLMLSDRAGFKQGNWCEGINTTFDLVISNPPYIPSGDIKRLQPEVRDYEPHAALIGGIDGLDCYREILSAVRVCMNKKSMIIFEIGAGQALDVSELIENAGFSRVSRHKDLSSIDRCISAFY